MTRSCNILFVCLRVRQRITVVFGERTIQRRSGNARMFIKNGKARKREKNRRHIAVRIIVICIFRVDGRTESGPVTRARARECMCACVHTRPCVAEIMKMHRRMHSSRARVTFPAHGAQRTRVYVPMRAGAHRAAQETSMPRALWSGDFDACSAESGDFDARVSDASRSDARQEWIPPALRARMRDSLWKLGCECTWIYKDKILKSRPIGHIPVRMIQPTKLWLLSLKLIEEQFFFPISVTSFF